MAIAVAQLRALMGNRADLRGDLLGLRLGAQVDRPHVLAFALQPFQPAAGFFLGLRTEIGGRVGQRRLVAQSLPDALGDLHRGLAGVGVLALRPHQRLARGGGQRRLGEPAGLVGAVGLGLGAAQRVGAGAVRRLGLLDAVVGGGAAGGEPRRFRLQPGQRRARLHGAG